MPTAIPIALHCALAAIFALAQSYLWLGAPLWLGTCWGAWTLAVPVLLTLSRWAALAVLNFNHHGVHHRYPGAPWNRLPALAASTHAPWDDGFFRLALRQMRGPIPLGMLGGRAPAGMRSRGGNRNPES